MSKRDKLNPGIYAIVNMIKNKGFYHGYYWEIIEPITGNSIYENRVKTGSIERIPSEVQEVGLCTENR